MSQTTLVRPPVETLRRDHALRSYAEEMPRIAERLEESGAVGVLLIDTTPLGQIEQAYGARVYDKAHAELSSLVLQLAEYRLNPDDMVTSGKTGIDELVVFLFRSRSDHRFYREELPALADAFSDHLRGNSQRIAFPYRKTAFHFPVGHGFALHNSAFREERLARRAMEQARQEAQLNVLLDARRRRKRFFDVLLKGEIRSIYEPIVQLSTVDVFGYEALVRGTGPDQLASPADLFAAAEDSGLTFEFDCLCRETALKTAQMRVAQGQKLFLNCLLSWVHDTNFHGENLQRTLDMARLSPSDIVFEISERESIDNFDYLRRARDHYGNLGFLIALDDTGVGYSSLESVMKLSPDFIKVDMSLVKGVHQDKPRQELLRALQSVASKLGTVMIAEGIETEGERDVLLDIGIPLGQGFLFTKSPRFAREETAPTGPVPPPFAETKSRIG
jgi:EAL domain-containing protein (putative c-di-GMP-specific phosphodiesterase class I)